MPRASPAIPANRLGLGLPHRGRCYDPVAPTRSLHRIQVTISAHGVQRRTEPRSISGRVFVSLGTSEDVVLVTDEVVERRPRRTRRWRRTRCWRRARSSASARGPASRPAASRRSAAAATARRGTPPAASAAAASAVDAVGRVGGPAPAAGQVVGGQPDLQLLRRAAPRPATSRGSDPSASTRTLCLPASSVARDQRRDARGRRCRSRRARPSGSDATWIFPGSTRGRNSSLDASCTAWIRSSTPPSTSRKTRLSTLPVLDVVEVQVEQELLAARADAAGDDAAHAQRHAGAARGRRCRRGRPARGARSRRRGARGTPPCRRSRSRRAGRRRR